MKAIGKRIKTARTYAGLSQQALADKIGGLRRQVQRWEADEQEPAASRITDIAQATGVTVNFLLGDFPRLPTTWAPLLVIPTTDDTPQTADEAMRLLVESTGDPDGWTLEDVEESLKTGWIEFLDGALVVWQDGDRDPDTDLLFQMLIK